MKKNLFRFCCSTVFISILMFTISLLSFQEALADDVTTTIEHSVTTTERGMINKTYYEGTEWGSNSTNHWGNNGDFFEIKFIGNKISLYGNKNLTNGKATVFIDNNEVDEISYNGTKANNILIYTKEGLSEEEHTIRVEAIGWVNHVSAVISKAIEKDHRQWINRFEALEEEEYTSQSWSVFKEILDRATEIVLDESATNEELDQAKQDVEKASKKLVMISGLRATIKDYKTRNQTDYTAESWQGFATALTLAESIVTQNDVTQEAIVSSKNKLTLAAENLVAISEGKFLPITNNSFWHDTDGNPIFSQGGGIFKFGDTYYWYGVRYMEALDYYNNPTKSYNPNSPIFQAITSYSSKDLVNWKFENNIATQETRIFIDSSLDVSENYFSRMTTLADASWIGRLGVVYNEKTGKYVLLTQMETKFDPVRETNASVLFLEGDSPTADFKYANIQTQIENAPVQGTGDQTVFTDDNGEDYLVFSGRNGRKHTLVSKISETDSLSLDPGIQIGYVGSGREGNAMFKLNDRYHAASSALHGWNTSETYMISSETDDIQGKYSNGYVLSGTEKDYSHVTQAGFFFKVKGTEEETVVYAGDRWSDFAWNGLGYNQWIPISEKENSLYFNSLSNWEFNGTTGEWRVSEKNNYILNPEFAADRIIVNKLVGWDNHISENSTNFVSNVSPGANGTRFALQLGAETSYEGSISQENELPSGVYQFKLEINNPNEITQAEVVIEGNENEKYVLPINVQTSGWQTLEFKDLKLTKGTVKVSIVAKSESGKQYIKVDNLSLVKQVSIIDKTALEASITDGEKIISSENNYTDASLLELETAINSGKNLLDSELITQKELDKAVKLIKEKIAQLEEKESEILPDSITLNFSGVKTLKIGKTLDLVPQIKPLNSTQTQIKWSVQQSEIAHVDENNTLVANKVGVARVTVETVNGKKATFTLRVTQ